MLCRLPILQELSGMAVLEGSLAGKGRHARPISGSRGIIWSD